ncbi:MAG: hypothetical protein GVY14_14030 [Spirochaetes bacterium]|jgi:adenine deaminase|nr:hypothetical protein [Spirochaetota bacterium]
MLADLAVVDDLTDFRVRDVFKRGELAAENGAPLFSVGVPDRAKVSDTVNVALITETDFSLPLQGDTVNVIERHRRTGSGGLGLIRGFGARGGAMATTNAHDSHNLLILGDSDADMLRAAEELVRIGGGMCIVADGEVLESLPLPISRLMTGEPAQELSRRMAALTEIARERLGVRRDIDPFTALSFMALPVIPEIKLTDMGLFDVAAFEFMPLEAT